MSDDSVYLHHILEAIQAIEEYVVVGHAEFTAASHWQDAVIRRLGPSRPPNTAGRDAGRFNGLKWLP